MLLGWQIMTAQVFVIRIPVRSYAKVSETMVLPAVLVLMATILSRQATLLRNSHSMMIPSEKRILEVTRTVLKRDMALKHQSVL